MTKKELYWMSVAAKALWRERVMRRALRKINKLPAGSTVRQWEEIRFQAVNTAFKALVKTTDRTS